MAADDTSGMLEALRKGDRKAFDALMSKVYEELGRIAHRELVRWRPEGTLRTTGLVHEAYIKLARVGDVVAEDRGQFLALAAKAMRSIVIDYARKRQTDKRGGGWKRVSLDGGIPVSSDRLVELLELDAALERLKGFDRRLYDVVECRYFGGLTVRETAEALGLSPRTVDRTWQRAKAWLHREIHAPQ